VSGFIGDFVAIAVDVVHSGKDLRCFKHHFYNVFVAVHLCSDWGRLVKYKNVHDCFSCWLDFLGDPEFGAVLFSPELVTVQLPQLPDFVLGLFCADREIVVAVGEDRLFGACGLVLILVLELFLGFVREIKSVGDNFNNFAHSVSPVGIDGTFQSMKELCLNFHEKQTIFVNIFHLFCKSLFFIRIL